MNWIFRNSHGLRVGWRLLLFIGAFFALGRLADWLTPMVVHLGPRPPLDPVGMIFDEAPTLVVALLATGLMAMIERRGFADYGIPVRSLLGRSFWIGLGWGIASTTLLIGLISAFGGFRISGLAIHGSDLWRYLALWTAASLLIGLSEEFQFRGYFLTTLAEAIGFWPAVTLLSVGFGALHYFLKPHERWEDFASTALLSLFVCLTLRRTGSLAFAIGFHAAFDFANLFVWSGQNAGQFAVGHLLTAHWDGPQWLTGGLLGPEASWMVFVVIGLMIWTFGRLYPEPKFPPTATPNQA